MSVAVYIAAPEVTGSRYSLLGAFACELAGAFTRAGADVNPMTARGRRAMFIIFDTPGDVGQMRTWIESAVGRLEHAAVLHLHVDHPLALPVSGVEEMSKWPGYRLLLACRDDAHILRLRWPLLKHMTCEHGVGQGALCDEGKLEAAHLGEGDEGGGDGESERPDTVVAMGTIHSQGELGAMLEMLPAALRGVAQAAGEVLTSHPSLSCLQAFDCVLPSGMLSADHWQLMAAVQRYATAHANRARRVAMIGAMQGIPTVVYGSAAWVEHCTGTIEYRGAIEYDNISNYLKRGRVCIAWGPAQFAQSFSERLLLALAAGCATVTDDRLMTRVAFGQEGAPACLIEDFSRPLAVREAVEACLEEPRLAFEIARRGVAAVAKGHLWDHRLERMFSAAVDCFEEGGGG